MTGLLGHSSGPGTMGLPRRGKVVGEQPHGQTATSSRESSQRTRALCLPSVPFAGRKSEPKAGSDTTRRRAPRWPSWWWQQESAFQTPGDSGVCVGVGFTRSQAVFHQEIPPRDPHPAPTSQTSPFDNKTIIIIIPITTLIWTGGGMTQFGPQPWATGEM